MSARVHSQLELRAHLVGNVGDLPERHELVHVGEHQLVLARHAQRSAASGRALQPLLEKLAAYVPQKRTRLNAHHVAPVSLLAPQPLVRFLRCEHAGAPSSAARVRHSFQVEERRVYRHIHRKLWVRGLRTKRVLVPRERAARRNLVLYVVHVTECWGTGVPTKERHGCCKHLRGVFDCEAQDSRDLYAF